MKLRQLRREAGSSSRKSMKLVSGERSESIVPLLLRRPSDMVEARLLSRREDALPPFFTVALTAGGITTSSSSSRTESNRFSTAIGSSSSSSSSLMLMKFRGRLTEKGRRVGERPSRAARAADLFRWRVLVDTVERNDGDDLSDVIAGLTLRGSGANETSLVPVSGGVGGAERVGEKKKYD